jgi:cytochrome c-type biogenesis protein CcmH/NrfF
MIRRLAVVVAIAACLTAAVTDAAAAATDYSTIESQFICVSCHEPLLMVHSPQAISEQQTLQGLVRKGLTISQIKSAMVDQYGVGVLARPPASGFNLTVYILPPLVFLGGVALLIYTLPKWRERARRVAPLKAAAPLKPEEAERLDDELSNFI